jgi:hypothetical protein
MTTALNLYLAVGLMGITHEKVEVFEIWCEVDHKHTWELYVNYFFQSTIKNVVTFRSCPTKCVVM